MKKILLISLFSFSIFAAKVGWKGNVFTAGSVIANGVLNVTATSDNFLVDPNKLAIINLNSDNAASALRSVVLSPGTAIGQTVRITCRPTGGNSQIDDDTPITGGFIRLVNNWICNQNGNSLNLFWNGTDWEENGRVNL